MRVINHTLLVVLNCIYGLIYKIKSISDTVIDIKNLRVNRSRAFGGNIIILMNEHSNKMIPKDKLLYP